MRFFWRQNILFFACLCVLGLVLASTPARAHESHGDQQEYPSVEELSDHLARTLEDAIRGQKTDHELEREAGEALLDTVFAEVVEELKADYAKDHSLTKQVVSSVRELVSGFNPVALGRWVIELARTQGPIVAVLIGVTELTENALMVYAVKHPAFLFVVPLYMTHLADVAMLGIAWGLPKFIQSTRVWRRHGGWVSGAKNYHEHLLWQRTHLPIDWGAVLDVSRLQSVDGREIEFAVITEGWVERKLSRKLRVLFSPRKLAMRESFTTLGLWELEAMARKGGVLLRALKPLKKDMKVYTAVLLREVSLNAGAAATLRALVEKNRVAGASAGLGKAFAFDPAVVFEDPSKLFRSARDGGETPDLAAQRLLWLLRERRDRVLEEAKHQAMGILPAQGAELRKLGKLLDGDQGLARIASSNYSGVTGDGPWLELSRAGHEAAALISDLEAQLPPLGHHGASCETVLTSPLFGWY